MTLNGSIMELVMMREHPSMPAVFKTSLDKVIETISECEEPSPNCSEIPNNCPTCGRCSDNEGFYDDGRTRCPIEEHYALPKDGYCHLYEPYQTKEDES